MRKIAPSQRLREELQRFLRDMGEVEDGGGALSELVRRAATLIVQEGLEAEQRDFIGRERHERGPGRGYRSGYVPGHLETAEGRLEVERPQVRGLKGTYRSEFYDFLRGHSDVLERLATEMYARGLSTRDIEAAFTDEAGVCLLSRSAASEVTETLWEEYEAFQRRDLSEVGVLYLFLDGLYEALPRHGMRREAVLCAWAITVEGEKVLLSLALGNRESYEPAGEGAGFEPARGEGAPGGDPRCADAGGEARGGPGFPGPVRRGVPQRLRLPERGPRGTAGPSEASVAAPEVCADDEPHRAQLRGGTPTHEDAAPVLHREELSEAGAPHADPGGDPLATHGHHRP